MKLCPFSCYQIKEIYPCTVLLLWLLNILCCIRDIGAHKPRLLTPFAMYRCLYVCICDYLYHVWSTCMRLSLSASCMINVYLIEMRLVVYHGNKFIVIVIIIVIEVMVCCFCVVYEDYFFLNDASSTSMKSSGLRTEPWCTPTPIPNSSLYWPLTRTQLGALRYMNWMTGTAHS